ncbi:hypothetical protein FG93_06084 [Bosea sp. LC85]|nr:hypothetical protein FG93_06084 [Bosea sp. LC85]
MMVEDRIVRSVEKAGACSALLSQIGAAVNTDVCPERLPLAARRPQTDRSLAVFLKTAR